MYYAPDAVAAGRLSLHTDNIKGDRTPEDLLFQVLVDWGVDLASPHRAEVTIDGKRVFFVDENACSVVSKPEISEEVVKEIAEAQATAGGLPGRSFGSDSVKINVEQIFNCFPPNRSQRSES